MDIQNKIRVLVVDDSLMSREMVIRGISSDPKISVVAAAADPFEARDKIITMHPDVITCDVEMPKMNGIEFVRRLLPQYFIPVVMVSAVSNAVFEAMAAGAVDFVVKPDIQSSVSVDNFICNLIQKIKIASTVKNMPQKQIMPSANASGFAAQDAETLIAIGASTGGTEAIFSILSALPPTIPGIVIVQHIPPVFSRMFAERLNSQTSFKAKEAETGDFVEMGKALVAPGDRHMVVKKIGKKFRVECVHGEKVNGHCPSVDVLFDSVAKEAGKNAVGILMTGMGYDGAKGLLSMRRKGSRTIGQDQASSVVYGMPKVAFDLGAVDVQAPLEKIPQVMAELLGR